MLSKAGAAALVALAALAQSPQRQAITVSAAVSLTDALTAVAEEYAKSGGGPVRFNYGASSVLARQILNGAPADVFISADEAQMDLVDRAHLLKDGSRFDLLTNQLAVVVPSDRPRTFGSIRDLLDPAFRRIAVGDPAAVPAGVYARQYLEREGIWAQLEPRIVPSGTVRAALNAVEAGAADAAIVYRTDARTATRATTAFVVPLEKGPHIVYPAAIVRGSRSPTEAARLLDFLRSAAAAGIVQRFGFGVAK